MNDGLHLWLIPVLPLAGFLLNAFLGRRISKGAAGAVACGSMLASFAVSAFVVWRLVGLPPEARAIVQPVFGVLFALVLLGEHLSGWEVVGGVAILGAVLLERSRRTVPEPPGD